MLRKRIVAAAIATTIACASGAAEPPPPLTMDAATSLVAGNTEYAKLLLRKYASHMLIGQESWAPLTDLGMQCVDDENKPTGFVPFLNILAAQQREYDAMGAHLVQIAETHGAVTRVYTKMFDKKMRLLTPPRLFLIVDSDWGEYQVNGMMTSALRSQSCGGTFGDITVTEP